MYLLIINKASQFLWVFLTKSKEPPLNIVETFLGRFGHADGGVLRTDQGGELVRSSKFCDTILHNYQYVIEPTGADSPSQNGAAEIYNGKLTVRARTLLFGSGLPAKVLVVRIATCGVLAQSVGAYRYTNNPLQVHVWD